MISEKDEQNFSFPTTRHNLVYVKLHINQFMVCHIHFSPFLHSKKQPRRTAFRVCFSNRM